MAITDSIRKLNNTINEKMSSWDAPAGFARFKTLLASEKEITVPEGQKANIYCNDKCIKTLVEGKHRIPARAEVEFLDIVEIADCEIGLFTKEDQLKLLLPGFYDIPKGAAFKRVPSIGLIPRSLASRLDTLSPQEQALVTRVTVQEGHLVLMTSHDENSETPSASFVQTPGIYEYWADPTRSIHDFDLSQSPDGIHASHKQLLLEHGELVAISLKADEVALHCVDGQFVGILPGQNTYTFWNVYQKHTFQTVALDGHRFDRAAQMYYPEFEPYLEHYDVPENHVGFYLINNNVRSIFRTPGTYSFWKPASALVKTEFKCIDVKNGMISDETLNFLNLHLHEREVHLEPGAEELWRFSECFEVAQGPGILCDGQNLIRYYHNDEACCYWNDRVATWSKLSFVSVPALNSDLFIELKDQSILTKDNACLKLNVICQFAITDYQEFCAANPDYKLVEQLIYPVRKENYQAVKNLYLQFQIAVRDFVSNHTLEENLSLRREIGQDILENLKNSEYNFGVALKQIRVKDFIFNSAYQEMQNKVLLAEKNAQIKAIERREEVNNNRTLLNTAKLMQENKVMFALRKLEAFERVCSNSREIKLAMDAFGVDEETRSRRADLPTP